MSQKPFAALAVASTGNQVLRRIAYDHVGADGFVYRGPHVITQTITSKGPFETVESMGDVDESIRIQEALPDFTEDKADEWMQLLPETVL